jgi:PST family polysaccharide transporter
MDESSKAEEERGSFRAILKSTSLIGGASVLNILIGTIRTKFVALLLGPAGVGLLGMYVQVTTLVSTVAGMGIATSGVRQVAEAAATSDPQRVARTVRTLRRSASITGALGMLLMACLAVPISALTFGDTRHSLPIAVLGVTVLLGSIAAGQSCLLQGTRRIGDIARITILGSLNGTLISIPCYYIWGVGGIVVALVLSSIAALATSWWFARRVPVAFVAMRWRDSWPEARALLALGASFMGAGIVAAGTTYAVQAILIRRFGVAGMGIYQAAFSLSGVLAGFVLGAMAADYYPRLTGAAGDNALVRRMVNEQSQLSTLLALPGLAAMMVFAPLIIRVFYASTFAAAVPVLRWCILGILGRVFSWPLGFVMLAKGRGRLFFATELAASAMHLGAVALFIRLWGLDGAGIAFATLYVGYTALMLLVMRYLIGAGWSTGTAALNAFATAIMLALTLNGWLNPHPISRWVVGGLALAATTWWCISNLMRRSDLGFSDLFSRFRR